MFNNIKKFVNNSFFMENIDNLAYFVLLSILISALILNSEYMGLLALFFSFLVIFKNIFKSDGIPRFNNYHKALFIYFLIVTVSLFASTLFSLSLHGYIKTFIYTLFFFCAVLFFKDNKNKVFPIIFLTAILMSIESFIAIAQNMGGVTEISGWQDMTSINPEEVVSRAYGTLKPYNPNLLAGYLLCGLSSFIYLILNSLSKNNKKRALIYCILFFINIIAIIVTGCRGAYLGFLLFFPMLFFALIYYIQKQLGGLSKIKKRYKNIAIALIVALVSFMAFNPAISRRIESIFALRADSSISFRLNVYESAIHMFLDNPIFGIGVGNQNFREIYGLYMKSGFDALGSYCVPLEIAVESGIFALIAFIIFIILVIKTCLNLCLNSKNTNTKILCLSTILMLLALIGHGFFDTIWFRPQLQFLFWTNIAMLSAIKE